MFNEHGDFNVSLEGETLLIVVTGAWNVETAKTYTEKVLNTIEPVKDKFWGLISDLNEWELCTPECELLLVKLFVECRSKGLKREAIVNNNTASVKLDLFHKHSKGYISETSSDGFKRGFFETDTAAREWLKQEGYGLK
jgi:hypothetical protein